MSPNILVRQQPEWPEAQFGRIGQIRFGRCSVGPVRNQIWAVLVESVSWLDEQYNSLGLCTKRRWSNTRKEIGSSDECPAFSLCIQCFTIFVTWVFFRRRDEYIPNNVQDSPYDVQDNNVYKGPLTGARVMRTWQVCIWPNMINGMKMEETYKIFQVEKKAQSLSSSSPQGGGPKTTQIRVHLGV